jgi:hypothetical protein
MPTTFQTTQNDVLDYVNRPSAEMLSQVKREINNTLLLMQRRLKLAMSERLITVEYPANTLMINVAAACDGRPRDIMSVQLLASATDKAGIPLKMRKYNQIVMEAQKYQRRRAPNYPDEAITEDVGTTFAEVMRTYTPGGMYAFLIADNVGLYPTPSEAKNILIHLHVFLDTLIDDTDTNYLLDNCYDYVLLKTLAKMSVYLKDDLRITVDDKEVAEAWDSVVQWNSEVTQTSPEPI